MSPVAIRSGLLALTVIVGGIAAPSTASAQTINQKIVTFCKNNFGKKVGDGQCTALANLALKAAGAKPWTSYTIPRGRKKDDYVWGREVYSKFVDGGLEGEGFLGGYQPQPGDIIQLRNVRLQGKTSSGTYWKSYGHHTAVIIEVRDKGKTFYVYEQNVGASNASKQQRERVQANTYNLKDMVAGELWVFRPMK